MDEHRLAELFRDAVRDTPPPSFDEGDVRTASRRVTVRRRTQLALGSTLVVVLGMGGVVGGTGLLTRPESSSTAGVAQSAPEVKDAPGDASLQSLPDDLPTQGGRSGGEKVDPDQVDKDAPQGCATVDRKLADALAVELSVPAGQAVPVAIGCPAASRAAAFVVDGARISAIVTPRGSAMQFQADTKFVQVPTASGQALHVFSEPADGPTAERVEAVASALLAQF